MYLNKVLKLLNKGDYNIALDWVHKELEFNESFWLYCLEAEISEAKNSCSESITSYTQALQIADKTESCYAHLQMARLYKQVYADNSMTIYYAETYFEQYPILKKDYLNHSFLLCYLYLEALINECEFEIVEELLQKYRTFQSNNATAIYLDILYAYKIENTEKANTLYKKVQNQRPFHIQNYDYIVPPLEKENLEKRFFENMELEIEASKLSFESAESTRYDLGIYGNYNAIFEITNGAIDKIERRLSYINDRIYGLINIEEKILGAEKLIIYPTGDKWYGDYAYFITLFSSLATYLDDYQFLLQDYNCPWVDYIVIKDNCFTYKRHFAASESWEDKLIQVEKISEKQPENEQIKKVISAEYLAHGRINLSHLIGLPVHNDKQKVEWNNKKRHIKKSLFYNPENVDTNLYMGAISINEKDDKEAKKHFTKASEDIEKGLKAHYYLGEMAKSEGDNKKAVLHWEKLIATEAILFEIKELQQIARQWIKTLLQLNPQFSELTITEIDEQSCAFYTYKFTSDKETITSRENSSYRTYNLGQSLMKIQEKIKEGPDNIEYWQEKGHTLFHLKEYEQAIETYEYAMTLTPPNLGKLYLWQSNTFGYLKRELDGIAVLEKALSISSNSDRENATYWGNKAWLYEQMGGKDKAFECIKKSIEFDDTYYYPYYLKACVFAKDKKTKEALKLIKKAVELDHTKKEGIALEDDFKILHKTIEFWNLTINKYERNNC